MRVLLVDDDVRIRWVLRRLFARCGFIEAIEAADGQEAIELLREEQVQLVVTDLQMPRLDGIALAREMRLSGDRTPILMMAAGASAATLATALRAGVDNVITLPFNEAIVREKIAQTFGLRAAA